MTNLSRISTILLLVGSLFLLTGCPATGVYRTAHTLGAGESDVALTFSGFRIEKVNNETNSDPITIPNLIPELSYHIGLGNNMEVGGRVALGSMLFEMDFKYKFFESIDKKLHMAIAPAIGYRTFLLIEGVNVNLPLILTYDLSRNFSINLFLYSSYIKFDTAMADDEADDFSDSGGFTANSVTVGGGIGFKYTGETFYFMPSVDFSRTALNFGDYAEDDSFAVSYTVFSITMGWIGGREMKKLTAMDTKLDRIENKLDNQNAPPPADSGSF
ncbi:hypothetical protein KKF84_05125 [Myxococcota bacterium]|nr:hypothetical protein [Myxococcota bacterium]MBU1534679.1 hypothetical protein [Myxococcota bacterium]